MPEIFSWKASSEWVRHSDPGPTVPDIDALESAFESCTVEVAFCLESDECGGQQRSQMTFPEFATIWRTNPSAGVYMKDFHLCIAGQSSAYETPPLFADDWLNSYTAASQSKGEDDFRFVYLGQSGTTTNFHRDVYASHSWSCSLAGIKRWRFVPPELAHLVRDSKTGDMPAELFGEGVERDYPNIGKARDAVLTVWQYPGESVFVPSGWLHEVKNFGETLSINHNWANASCLSRMSAALSEEVRLGELALEGFDLGSSSEVSVLVQDLTLRNFGWSWKEYFEMIRWRYLVPRSMNGESTSRWTEAVDDLRPPWEVEKSIVAKVVTDWLDGDAGEHLPEVTKIAEEILTLLGEGEAVAPDGNDTWRP
ncbi:hypothetical protein JAAARDRAFT_193123 [Jaapia argillacea MUCL 33604]|uniref:JmjC domain-containing protein n=1 Tax=Jaapia argillacea MUCL 33604 TaxID=933084 RepID=A0A067Q510_9AGAM|nr:hypothetical protein JAAARDRAFT_193123 [Jaapia argillacea MUCL 33604]